MESQIDDRPLLRAWLKSESGQTSDCSLPLRWEKIENINLVMPIICRTDLELLESDRFWDDLQVEFNKRNK